MFTLATSSHMDCSACMFALVPPQRRSPGVRAARAPVRSVGASVWRTFDLLMQLARMDSVLYRMVVSVAMLAGWDTRAVILAGGGIVTAYTLVSGLVAVVWSDA